MELRFEEEYKKLNTLQKKAVDTIEGPVMVVAGPGTGKTQILSLRIANILTKTDTHADGILCLTFTNSGVSAMKDRLSKYIGVEASKVNVFTFHSFGMRVIEENYEALGFSTIPKTLDDSEAVMLVDEILNENEWEYIRPRGDVSRYFRDLKSLISTLKRERIGDKEFLQEIETDIKSLISDPENISSRGPSKGELKKEVEKKIEGLNRTKEVVKFFSIYEHIKQERNVLDYDDILLNLVKLVEISDDVASSIREKYLYVLIDEHQDSSSVQNEFLKVVWGEVEKPNIFVVGDDRQLIYGFGGASLAYFEGFKNLFGKAELITLVENYRSTQTILDSAHVLLESSISKDKLKSNRKESHPINLVECDFPRDEIIFAALDIKNKVKEEGIDMNDCAILVPKNSHARSASVILKDMGIPVASYGTLNLFESSIASSMIRILKIIKDPYDGVSFGESLFDPLSDIPPISAHKFIREKSVRNLSLMKVLEESSPLLFQREGATDVWISKLEKWVKSAKDLNIYSLVQEVGKEYLLDTAKSHEELVHRIEVVRTILHLALSKIEKNPKVTLNEFMEFLDRLESYGEHIPLAVFEGGEGVKVLTLHSSKGLEFDYVFIAHMDENSFASGRRGGFTLPSKLEEKVEKKDVEVLKRQLYVAITRAKRFCSISYAVHSYTGRDLELANIIKALPESIFNKKTKEETEKLILKSNPKAYIEKAKGEDGHVGKKELVDIVKDEFTDRNVSVSLLNNFFECPWKWYFRNLLQLPEPKSESLEFGNTVHSTIDKMLKMKSVPKESDILELTKGDKEASNLVSRWVETRLKDISKERENEKSVSVKDKRFKDLNIYGKIDLVESLSKDEVRVTDFKTGSVKKKGDIEKEDAEGRMSNLMRQLAMYSYLIRESTDHKKDVRESRLEFLEAKNEKESIYEKVISKREIELLVKDIEDYESMLRSGGWLERPCNFNSYGKATVCEYCKMAEIYK
ncbi:MAG: ATP-dependent helicase [Candidatus Pacebacteria bacterium]|nr:ATP-dependent helicase [Candidatus Paceibacterota bacterium]MBP9839809.1 ATP-dependent helicase [Candidatus Paceibacterota bacterium]